MCVLDVTASAKLYYCVGIVDKAANRTSWGEIKSYDTGEYPSVALVVKEQLLYAVEVHTSQMWFSNNIFYNVGVVNVSEKSISWGSSTRVDKGKKPRLASGNDGMVLLLAENTFSSQLAASRCAWGY